MLFYNVLNRCSSLHKSCQQSSKQLTKKPGSNSSMRNEAAHEIKQSTHKFHVCKKWKLLYQCGHSTIFSYDDNIASQCECCPEQFLEPWFVSLGSWLRQFQLQVITTLLLVSFVCTVNATSTFKPSITTDFNKMYGTRQAMLMLGEDGTSPVGWGSVLYGTTTITTVKWKYNDYTTLTSQILTSNIQGAP